MTVAILIPAAGFGRRMGGADKLLELVDGMPLLRRTVLRALSASSVVLVTVPALDHARAAALDGLPITRIPVADNAEGMAASLRSGVAALPENTDAVMIVPGDMPDLTGRDFTNIINSFKAEDHVDILRGATDAGTPGHPVLFPSCYFDELAKVAGDQGAKAVVQAHRDKVKLIALPGQNALTDLDTPEAWAAWRAQNDLP